MNGRDLRPDQIEAILATLTLPGSTATVLGALRGAVGGYMPAWALAALGRARAQNETLREACEAAEQRQKSEGAQAEGAGDLHGVAAGHARTDLGDVPSPEPAEGGDVRRGQTPSEGAASGSAARVAVEPAVRADVRLAGGDVGGSHRDDPAAQAPGIGDAGERRRDAADDGRPVVAAPPVVSAPAAAWAAAVKASAERRPPVVASVAPVISDATTARDRQRDEILRAHDGPELFRYLLAVEAHRIAANMHPTDPLWLMHFHDFYESGKMIDVGRFGVRAAKSDSTCSAVTAEVVWLPRKLEPGVTGVCPIMSSKMSEASDRFETIKATLRAHKFAEITGKGDPGAGEFKATGGGSQALVVALLDARDHPVEFRIYPASVSGAAGFTGIAGFGDELDLWGAQGGANPARRVIEVLATRYTTQPGAKLHLMSATYDRESEHAAMIARGDTPRQRVARLGLVGASKDYDDRRRLAETIKSRDPLLVAPPLPPRCPDNPTWVYNPIAPIEYCYAAVDGDVRRMFAIYGGRPDVDASGTDVAGQCILAANLTAHVNHRRPWSADTVPAMSTDPADPANRPQQPNLPRAFAPWKKRGVF